MLNYPLLCWNLPGDHIMGWLLGSDYQLVDSNIKKLKNKFSDRLKKDQEDEQLVYPDMKDFALKIFPVTVQPAYKQDDGVFPVINPVNIPVPAIYGQREYGYFQCFLPFFNFRFYYYSPEQLISLVEHFVKDLAKDFSPEAINHFLLSPSPFLETVSIREKKNDEEEKPYFFDKFKYLEILPNIAEKLPSLNSEQKKLKFFPETAWEQGEKVKNLMDKIANEKANILVVGAQGTGKSVIIQEAIRKIHLQEKTDKENGLSFWKTTSHRMISGARYLGDWQEICEKLVEELENVNGVLWVTDFTNLFNLGGEGPEDSVAAFLQPFIQQGKIKLLSELSINELDASRRLLPGFTDNFQTIFIEEMKQQKLLKVLNLFNEYTEKNFSVEIEKPAIELSYRLLNRYIKYENFPGKVIKFLSHCLNEAYYNKQTGENNEKKIHLKKEDILNAFIDRTGLPAILLKDEQTLSDAELHSFFSGKIIGQEDAIEKICSVIKIFKAGLNDPGKPVATMLFAGPTGVGKTASARMLARYFFSSGQKKDPLIRLDMSELQYPEQIDRLIGNRTETGKFIQQIRENPFSVILFDEIEKANPLMFDILLNVLDEGILVDSLGRVTDFRNTIIIMTTNLGSEQKNSIGFGSNKNQGSNHLNQIKTFFRSEFFNRIDYVVSFNPLNEVTIREIVIKELEEVKLREGLTRKNINLKFSKGLITYLSEIGFDIRYGARPLQRTIEKLLITKVARYLLENQDLKNCLLKIDLNNVEVTISR